MGYAPPELIAPPFPERYAYIWDMFLSLHSGRSCSSSGPNPLSWADMKAWSDIQHIDLKEWEVRAIKTLDMTWLNTVRESRSDD